jgi:hypothetical protein
VVGVPLKMDGFYEIIGRLVGFPNVSPIEFTVKLLRIIQFNGKIYGINLKKVDTIHVTHKNLCRISWFYATVKFKGVLDVDGIEIIT